MAKIKDITNMQFGKLLVVSFSHVDKNRNSRWNCQCDCGNVVKVAGSSLRKNTRSCGCIQKETTSKRFLIDLTGKRFGRLIVINRSSKSNKKKDVMWECNCDCGETLPVLSRSLIHGRTNSCGCYHHDVVSLEPYQHLYHSIQRRTYTDKKGNKKCKLTFDEFLEYTKINNCHYCNSDVIWLKHGTGRGHVYNIDRKDNDVPYTKDNCVVCCGQCNYLKRSLPYDRFYMLMKPIREFNIRRQSELLIDYEI